MKHAYILCMLALVALLGSSCEKVIEFKGEVADPRLTISAEALAGEPFRVYVASSVFFLQAGNDFSAYTKNLDTLRGQVRCFVNGGQTSRAMVLRSGEGFGSYCYLAEDYVPAPGDHIRLEAEFPGFDPVWAETDVPLLPQLDVVSVGEWKLMEKSWEGEPDYYEVELTLRVTDDGSYDKYYCLQPIAVYYFEPTGSDFIEVVQFKSNDIIFQQVDVSAFQRFDFETGEAMAVNYFPDQLFKGQSYTFKIQLVRVPGPPELHLLGLKIATVSESLYWYDMSYSQQEYHFNLFAEGVTLYSNVQGGYGVLCSAAPRWIDIFVEE